MEYAMERMVNMEIRFNVTGAERKALVTAVSEITGCAAVYKGAPSFAFAVNNYTVDRYGTLVFDGRTEAADARNLLERLAERGFVSEDSFDGDSPDKGLSETSAPMTGDDPERLVIEVPDADFTDTALNNLEKLAAGKAPLIRKAVGLSQSGGTETLPIERGDGRIRFPWFPPDSSPEEVTAYTHLVSTLCETARNQARVTAKEKPVENEKYAMRCFLLRLGFIGKEYAVSRKILLKNLTGDGSFKGGKRREQGAPVAAHAVFDGRPDTDSADAETGGHGADNLAEALADAELIYNVNASFEEGATGNGGNE